MKQATVIRAIYKSKIGINHYHDAKIKKSARRESVGSGYCFGTYERDLEFYFFQDKAAQAAKRRIKRLKNIKGLIVETDSRELM